MKVNQNIPDEKITAAGCLVISADGKIAAFARSKDDGGLGLPAGKRESGETVLECAVREVKEETGLDITFDISKEDALSFIFKPDDMNRKGEDKYCQTFVVYLEQASEELSFSRANTYEDGVVEGVASWVTPKEFISKNHSAFLEYNTELLRYVGLV